VILVYLVALPLVGGILAWAVSRASAKWARWISLAAMCIELALGIAVWLGHYPEVRVAAGGRWFLEFECPWIPQFGINFHLGLDSLSLLLIVLTAFLGVLSIACSWTEIQTRVGFFHFNLLWVLGGIVGVFLALDLFLFYFFWEMMLIPMYFLIAIWGHERRVYASIKFFIFTQLSGLLMLVSILALYFIHGANTGTYTFNYMELLGTRMPESTAMWIMFGFLIAFIVKLPVVPFHTWLPDAHTEAPTAGSVILAGILLKTGAYGLLRFVLPLFPGAASSFAPVGMVLGVVGVLYGALLAFGQTDLKRLVAYTSVSHMGFVMLGVFAWTELGLQGTVIEMICHGISTGALFILVGALQERAHTREIDQFGGVWSMAPRMGAVALIFALASLGLPGLGNFVGEFLILLGSYTRSPAAAAWAAVGLVSAAVYSLWMFQKTFQETPREKRMISDLSGREIAIFAALTVAIVWLGMYPQPVLRTTAPAVRQLDRPAAGNQRSELGESKIRSFGLLSGFLQTSLHRKPT
jgi:NADH-quinone oxidoreductase subunit M